MALMKSRPLKWIAVSTIVLLGLIIVFVFIAKSILIPSGIRKKITAGLSEFWDGQVKIGRVEFNYSKPVYIRDIALRDKAGNEWFTIKTLTAVLKDWQSGTPKVKDIEIDDLKVQAHLTGGKLIFPVHSSSEQKSGQKQNTFDIDKITVKNASLLLSDESFSQVIYENLSLSITRNKQIYDVSLRQQKTEPVNTVLIEGTVDALTFAANLSLKANKMIDKDESRIAFTALKIPQQYQAQGNISADLRITGSIKKPDSFQMQGVAVVDNSIVFRKKQPIAERLSMDVAINNRRISSENITCTFCKGRVNGAFDVDFNKSQPARFNGRVLAKDIDLAQLAKLLETNRKFKKGDALFQYNFTCIGKDLQALNADGMFIINDADIGSFPVFTKIFKSIGLSMLNPAESSDAGAVFTMKGSTANISEAHLTNRLGAIQLEPGGKVDIKSGQLDFYVVAVPIKEIDDLIKRIPVAELFVNLKDKLTRLHVKGHWSQPPAKLITKEPLKDIKQGTVDFLTGAVKTEGQLRDFTIKKFKDIFENLGKKQDK